MEPSIRPVPILTGPEVVFGETRHMPPMSAIPERFRDEEDPWCAVVADWFYDGWSYDGLNGVTFVPKPGVDTQQALTAVKAILRSYAPKHEHKMAACAFLLSEWFERCDLATTEGK